MLNNIPDIFYNKNINTFVSTITKELSNAIEKYWEQEVELTLLAINSFKEFREEKLIAKTDFFSSLIKVEKHKPLTIRLSKECVKSFFDSVLTFSEGFKLSALTSLEVRILNNFCEFLYKRLKEELVPTKDLKLTPNSEKNLNLIFLAKLKNTSSFKFAITIPLDRVKFDEINKETNFTDEDFLTSQTMVRIRAGKTKVTLMDLESISESDIVLLEDSDITKLTLISGSYEQKFNVKTDPSLVLNVGGGEEENYNDDYEVTMEKNLWDDIQIEVNAEFEKVKMTIGELKQITQGQIVDLGSVFNNEISLFVENKKVAKGELIIINDKYAVRLNEVISKPKKIEQTKPVQTQAQPQPQPKPQAQPKAAQTPPPKQPQPQAQPQPKAQPQPQAQPQEDEDFDYSDFEK